MIEIVFIIFIAALLATIGCAIRLIALIKLKQTINKYDQIIDSTLDYGVAKYYESKKKSLLDSFDIKEE